MLKKSLVSSDGTVENRQKGEPRSGPYHMGLPEKIVFVVGAILMWAAAYFGLKDDGGTPQLQAFALLLAVYGTHRAGPVLSVLGYMTVGMQAALLMANLAGLLN
jgi:hypothetical protein